VPNLLGPFDGNLANEGEELELRLPAPLQGAILRFAYDDNWFPATDGDGFSLEVVAPWPGSAVAWSSPDAWQASQAVGGSPGLSQVRGDIDADLALTAADIDALYAHVRSPRPPSNYDLTGDRITNQADVDELVSRLFGTFYGDTDVDGDVDFIDFLTLANNYGMPNMSWSAGSFDGDGDVDFSDFAALASSFGNSAISSG
jgi:hypothetical protein